MVRLSSSLERRLAELFPRIREREQFVADTLEQALSDLPPPPEPSGAQYDSYIPMQQSSFDVPVAQSVGGTLHLFTDGGSRGNPGEAAIAYVIEDAGRGVTLKEHGERIGIETNNVAEYRALIEGLRMAQNFHPNRLICHMDSELIVRQLNGQYQVKMPTMQTLNDEVKHLASQFPAIFFKHIPRSDNHRADALVNKALDAGGSRPYVRPPMQAGQWKY